jgi:hypothetical protein
MDRIVDPHRRLLVPRVAVAVAVAVALPVGAHCGGPSTGAAADASAEGDGAPDATVPDTSSGSSSGGTADTGSSSADGSDSSSGTDAGSVADAGADAAGDGAAGDGACVPVEAGAFDCAGLTCPGDDWCFAVGRTTCFPLPAACLCEGTYDCACLFTHGFVNPCDGSFAVCPPGDGGATPPMIVMCL